MARFLVDQGKAGFEMSLVKPKAFYAGVDEAGRGPLAGPVAAAAVILNPKCVPDGLNDSKLLTFGEREELFIEITRNAVAIGVAFSCNHEIDRVNIRIATLNAMRRALNALCIVSRHALIDGRDVPENLCVNATAIIDGDASHACIAAASIVAKVVRDRKMIELDRHYPSYGFASHKGYSTPQHHDALDRHGPCPLHRQSFAPVRQMAFAI
jgi:ribonuclease HII